MENRTRSGVENSCLIEPCSPRGFAVLEVQRRLGHEHADQDRHDGRHDADGEQAAPAPCGDDGRAQQRSEQHAHLETQAHAGGRLGPVLRAGCLGGDGHADAELGANAHARQKAARRHEREVGREGRKQREQAEEHDRIGQHADAAVLVRHPAEHQTAQERAGQRDRGERARRGLVDVEARHDARHREAEDHQVEAVEGVPHGRREHRQTGIVLHAAGSVHCLLIRHEHGLSYSCSSGNEKNPGRV
nr:hypothetical protein [Bifidobacterium vespertilionis]